MLCNQEEANKSLLLYVFDACTKKLVVIALYYDFGFHFGFGFDLRPCVCISQIINLQSSVCYLFFGSLTSTSAISDEDL